MANTKISNLTGAASVTDASVFPVVDSGSTKKVTGTQIKTYARSGLATVATSGSYADLTNKPSIFSGAYTDLTGKPSLFSGSYTDLTNKPTLFDGNYNSLTNKPTLFDGSYNSLTSKPSLFSGSYSDLTNKPIISDTTSLTGGQFFIAKDTSTIQLGQWAAQAITIGSSGIQIAGTGGVEIAGIAGASVTLGGETSGTITFSSATSGINYDDLSNKPTIPTDINQLSDSSNLLGQGGGGSGTGNLIITDTTITSNTSEIIIGANQTASPAPGFYRFTSDGGFAFPNNIKQLTTDSTLCVSNVDNIIYVGTDTSVATYKIILKAEGEETYGAPFDSQSCELMISRAGSKVAGSVYGLVYTSTNPLATFSTRLNASGQVEVICRTTNSFSVLVRAFITEITTSY